MEINSTLEGYAASPCVSFRPNPGIRIYSVSGKKLLVFTRSESNEYVIVIVRPSSLISVEGAFVVPDVIAPFAVSSILWVAKILLEVDNRSNRRRNFFMG